MLEFEGSRLIDIAIRRFAGQVETILLSAPEDFGTGLSYIPDDADAPSGPVGAIFSIAARLRSMAPETVGFVTVPVDAPFAPDDLVSRLFDPDQCAVASGPERLHPTFADWICDTVDAVRRKHEVSAKAPSLHWLMRQCDAKTVHWADEHPFLNINTPDDLNKAQSLA